MTILVFLPTLPAYRKSFLSEVNRKLREAGVSFAVLHGSTSRKTIKETEDCDFVVKPLVTKERDFLNSTFTTLALLSKNIEDMNPSGVVFLFNPGILSFWEGIFYCYRKRIPYGIWSSGYTRPGLSGFKVAVRNYLLNIVYKNASVHICYGSGHSDYLKLLGIDKSKIFIAQNTINVERIISSTDLNSFQNKYGTELKILFVGAVIKNKNLKLSMKVIDNLISKGLNISFTIVGDGEERGNLVEFWNGLRNREYINIVGSKYGDELNQIFREAELFLLTGSGGLAINEAMAYGLPVISTYGDGTVKDLLGDSPLLLHATTEDEVTSRIEYFYSLDRSDKINIALSNRKSILAKASMSNMVDNYLGALSELVK